VKCYTVNELRTLLTLIEEGNACKERLFVARESIENYKSMYVIANNDLMRVTAANKELKKALNASEAKQSKLKNGKYFWMGIGLAGGIAIYHYAR